MHGGPGLTHEYLEAFDSDFPGASSDYYYDDQLGSAYSDQPDAPQLRGIPRFVEEVEQARQALNLAKDIFLYGPSWGGTLVKMAGVSSGGCSILVYFHCSDCAVEETRAVKAGGKIQKAKMSIGEYGFNSLVEDTEGNLIGLHSIA